MELDKPQREVAAPHAGRETPLLFGEPATVPELSPELAELAAAIRDTELPRDEAIGLAIAQMAAIMAARSLRLEAMRSEMIATVSHELRTPLASVYGAARTLQRVDLDIDDATREALVEMVATECERLNRIVDEFLLASSLDRHVDVAREAVDVAALARELVLPAQARAGDSVAIDLDGLTDGLYADADAAKLRQVLMNLLDNALKYGGAGGRVELGTSSGDGTVYIWVRDFGKGISPVEHDLIFERFYRSSPEASPATSGTGLGLYISRELITRMGGQLRLESTAERGTTFTVELPQARA